MLMPWFNDLDCDIGSFYVLFFPCVFILMFPHLLLYLQAHVPTDYAKMNMTKEKGLNLG